MVTARLGPDQTAGTSFSSAQNPVTRTRCTGSGTCCAAVSSEPLANATSL